MEQADKYLDALFSRFEWLCEHPYTGKNREDIKNGYYCFPEGMHLVFYAALGSESSARVSSLGVKGEMVPAPGFEPGTY